MLCVSLPGLDLALLSLSHHSILTYGTFSMWGALFSQANNNRLANYIDKVRQLQTENRRMTKQIQDQGGTCSGLTFP